MAILAVETTIRVGAGGAIDGVAVATGVQEANTIAANKIAMSALFFITSTPFVKVNNISKPSFDSRVICHIVEIWLSSVNLPVPGRLSDSASTTAEA